MPQVVYKVSIRTIGVTEIFVYTTEIFQLRLYMDLNSFSSSIYIYERNSHINSYVLTPC